MKVLEYDLPDIDVIAEKIIRECIARSSDIGLNFTIILNGDLGSGKTRLASSMIRYLSADYDLVVQSPTYSIMKSYFSSDGIEIVHMDLYRLHSLSDIYDLGIQTIIGQKICIIEWPDLLLKALGHIPACIIDIKEIDGHYDKREIVLSF